MFSKIVSKSVVINNFGWPLSSKRNDLNIKGLGNIILKTQHIFQLQINIIELLCEVILPGK